MSRGVAAIVVVMLQACVLEEVEAPQAPGLAILEAEESVYELERRGRSMSEEVATSLEQRLAEEPGDLGARTQLIAFYWNAAIEDRAAISAGGHAEWLHAQHVLWLIEHEPRAAVLATPFAELESCVCDRFEEGAALWMKQIAEHSTDPRVLWNAAAWLAFEHEDVAKQLLVTGRQLQPDESKWSFELGMHLSLDLIHAPQAERARLATQSLEAYEDALADAVEESEHFYHLPGVAEAAYDAGQDAIARFHAEELLAMAERFPDDWNFGNAVHHGNTVLGKIALREGDVTQALVHLRRAGASEGSPQLNSFGPSMELAKALLERGERVAVLDYLIACSRFWKGEDLDEWIDSLRTGGSPDLDRYR